MSDPTKVGFYHTKIVTQLLDQIEILEKELRDQKDISADRFFEICELEDKLYTISCPICKRTMTIVEEKDRTIDSTGTPCIKDILLSCSHPRRR